LEAEDVSLLYIYAEIKAISHVKLSLLIISGFLDILTKGGERHFLKKCPSLFFM
jgi:hypothetical protein